MIKSELIKAIEKHRGPVHVTMVMRNESPSVRVYKSDLITMFHNLYPEDHEETDMAYTISGDLMFIDIDHDSENRNLNTGLLTDGPEE